MPPDDLEIDMGAALASMDEEFGGGSETALEGAPSPTPAAPAAAPSPAPAAQPAEWEALPKAWKAEMAPHWAAMTPEQRKYVHDRERQQLEGIMQYKGKVDKWDQTLKPFEKFIAENKLDPYESVARLGAVELILRNGNDQEKAAYLGEMIRHYGLAPVIQQLMGQQPGQQAAQYQRDPLLIETQKELSDLKAWRQQQQEQVSMSQVTAFLDDPKNVFAGELIEDMTRIIGEGRATDLASAYEQAMWLNPAVRQKVLDSEIKKATTPPASGPRVVRSNATSKPAPTEKAKGTMEDTMRETLAAIHARG